MKKRMSVAALVVVTVLGLFLFASLEAGGKSGASYQIFFYSSRAYGDPDAVSFRFLR